MIDQCPVTRGILSDTKRLDFMWGGGGVGKSSKVDPMPVS